MAKPKEYGKKLTAKSGKRKRPEAPETQLSFLERRYGGQSPVLIAAVLLFGCTIIYFQVKSFDFINFDDGTYVYRNPSVLGGLTVENIRWAFSTFYAANWHPLTWLSHQLDITLFGFDPGSHHLTNVVLHSINSLLLFFALRYLFRSTWKSGVIAAIFAFHPAHVESVAWVAERKDVLSTLFLILACWAYGSYVRNERPVGRYLLVLLLFGLGLMAKPMLVTLPFVFLLLDFFPLERFKEFKWKDLQPLLIEKAPLFALSILSSVVTFYAQRSGGAMVALEKLPVSMRIENAFVSYFRYVATFFYPVNLSGWYPYPENGNTSLQIAGAVILFLLVGGYAFWNIHQKKYFFVGWAWFIGTLVPVIGLVQVGIQSHADRYTYVPFIGLSIAVVWLVSECVDRLRINKDLITVLTAAILVVLGVLSYRQTGFWKENEVFYRHTLAVTTRNYLFEQNYCQHLIDMNRLEEAEFQCRNSIANYPNYINSWQSLGVIQMKKGKFEDALQSFGQASSLRPGDIEATSNYINALIALGRLDEAAEKAGLIAASDLPNAISSVYLLPVYRLLGYAYAQKEKDDQAIDHLRKAIAIDETKDDLHSNLGFLLFKKGQIDDAFRELNSSLALNPNQADIHNAIGKILLLQGKNSEAADRFRTALQIDPGFAPAAQNLKTVESRK